MTMTQAIEMVQHLKDGATCPVCNDEPLIDCFPGSHKDSDCYDCDDEGQIMCPCQNL